MPDDASAPEPDLQAQLPWAFHTDQLFMKSERIELGALGVIAEGWEGCEFVRGVVSAPMTLDWGVTGAVTGGATGGWAAAMAASRFRPARCWSG